MQIPNAPRTDNVDFDLWLNQFVEYTRIMFKGKLSEVVAFTDADATPDVGDGNFFKTANTGATTIAMFDGGSNGQIINVLIADANTTIDFTGTNLKGNGGADWLPAANDHLVCISDGTNWYCSTIDAAISRVDHIFIPADLMSPTTTNGCDALAINEYGIDMKYLAFDNGNAEWATINIQMPPSWDRGTIKVKFHWAGEAGCSENDIVTWLIKGAAVGNDDPLDSATHGDSVYVDDTITAGTSNDLLTTAPSPALTIGGTPALGDIINLSVFRGVGEYNDDMEEDAWLLGLTIEYSKTNEVTAW